MAVSFQTRTVFFPPNKLGEEFITTYLTRYTQDITEGVILDGIEVEQSPAESDTQLSTIFRDNDPLTRYRKASIFDGTISPSPVYDPPLEPEDNPEDFTPIGHTIRCGWPTQFLNDIVDVPEGDEELFSGVRIVE